MHKGAVNFSIVHLYKTSILKYKISIFKFLFLFISVAIFLKCRSSYPIVQVSVEEKIEKIIEVIIIKGDDVDAWLKQDNASREYMYDRLDSLNYPEKAQEFWSRLDVFFEIQPKLPPPHSSKKPKQ